MRMIAPHFTTSRTVSRRVSAPTALLTLGYLVSLWTPFAKAENLGEAWSIALSVNQNLQAQQARSVSAGYTLAAARSARLPTVKSYNFEAFLARGDPWGSSQGTSLRFMLRQQYSLARVRPAKR